MISQQPATTHQKTCAHSLIHLSTYFGSTYTSIKEWRSRDRAKIVLEMSKDEEDDDCVGHGKVWLVVGGCSVHPVLASCCWDILVRVDEVVVVIASARWWFEVKNRDANSRTTKLISDAMFCLQTHLIEGINSFSTSVSSSSITHPWSISSAPSKPQLSDPEYTPPYSFSSSSRKGRPHPTPITISPAPRATTACSSSIQIVTTL